MSPSTDWIVVKAMHPTSSTTQIPAELAELLGIPPEKLATFDKPSRVISFLNRGEGLLRVIANVASGDLYIKELSQHHVVGMGSVAPNLSFNLPDSVERFLKLTTYPLERPGLTGTDDSLAWLSPAEEILAYRKAVREGRRYTQTGERAHAYLVKAVTNTWLGPLDAVERSRARVPLATPHVRSGATHRAQLA
jgi:hypothetical protein